MLKPNAAQLVLNLNKDAKREEDSANAIMNKTLNQTEQEIEEEQSKVVQESESISKECNDAEKSKRKSSTAYFNRRKTFIIKDAYKELHLLFSATKKFNFKSSFHFSSSN